MSVDFLKPLIEPMVVEDPSKRPSIDEVLVHFEEIVGKLSWFRLRSRIVKKQESGLGRAYRRVRHVFRAIGYLATFTAAVPSRS